MKREDGKKMRKRNDSARYQLPSSVLNLLVPSPRHLGSRESRITMRKSLLILCFLFKSFLPSSPESDSIPFFSHQDDPSCHFWKRILLSIPSLQFTQWLSFRSLLSIPPSSHYSLLILFPLCLSGPLSSFDLSHGILVFFPSMLSLSLSVLSSLKRIFYALLHFLSQQTSSQ